MPRVKDPMMSSSVSGHWAELEFKRNLSGNVVGRKSTTKIQRSLSTTAARSRFSAAARAWSSLTPAQRTALLPYYDDPGNPRASYIGQYCRLALAGLEEPHPPTPAQRAGLIEAFYIAWQEYHTDEIELLTYSNDYINTAIKASIAWTLDPGVTIHPRSFRHVYSAPFGDLVILSAQPHHRDCAHLRIETFNAHSGQTRQVILYPFEISLGSILVWLPS